MLTTNRKNKKTKEQKDENTTKSPTESFGGIYCLEYDKAVRQLTGLGGIIVGDPSCAGADDGTGEVICAAKGTDNALYGIRLNPATGFSTGYRTLGGIIVDDPSCASANDGSGEAICAAKGTDDSLYGIRCMGFDSIRVPDSQPAIRGWAGSL